MNDRSASGRRGAFDPSARPADAAPLGGPARAGAPLIRRRTLLLGAGAGLAATTLRAQGVSSPADPGARGGFGFENVVDQARTRAEEGYSHRRQSPGGVFGDLGYDAYRGIRVRPEARLWRGEDRGFEVDPLPPGAIYQDRVAINLVEDGAPREVPFDPAAFDFDPAHFDLPEGRAPAEAAEGHAWTGFRLRFPLNRPEAMDEIAVFQGASYFRGVGRDQIFGLSARALTIRTGLAEGEEFPVFTDFWLHRPEAGANEIRVDALLDSPSLAGAYAFLIRPGAETTMDIDAVLFPRERVEEVGLAPMTSMYFFGPASPREVQDYRDAVHDSNGVQMLTGGGERVWRALANPATLQISSFMDQDPKGFGLAQRPRAFAHYQDAEARYDRRPSAWVAPKAKWGAGGVRLIEIPSDNEFNDNVVAFWRPEAPLEAGTERRFAYRLYWCDLPPDDAPTARVSGTRRGRSIRNQDRPVMIVDFDGAAQTAQALAPELEAPGAEVISLTLSPLPSPDRLRVAIEFQPEDDDPVEFRLRLVEKEGGAPVSETWLYRWTAT